MRVFLGMILGALLLVCGVYVHDSMQSTDRQVAEENRNIVNWDVAAHDWNALKTRAHQEWTKVAAK
ncbi:hypothetical protein IC762_05070 [Bradyrhizobium genosp. L]|uniref:hypothetical protein n=1 Tax=Bradyrhizobium genosp. L TaxID=83637 RepID=UPI0018A31A3B|nr:hypothetical protein [Bradyrhizobium genosp. L]QPF85685.1 hypothetical protein IC762_05070 [Bradyrhizobium genosp. L]